MTLPFDSAEHSVTGRVVSQAKEEGMLLSKFVVVSYAVPCLPLKQRLILLELCSISSVTAVPKLRKLTVVLYLGHLINEWSKGRFPILWIC